jgi:hypothetical protein
MINMSYSVMCFLINFIVFSDILGEKFILSILDQLHHILFLTWCRQIYLLDIRPTSSYFVSDMVWTNLSSRYWTNFIIFCFWHGVDKFIFPISDQLHHILFLTWCGQIYLPDIGPTSSYFWKDFFLHIVECLQL